MFQILPLNYNKFSNYFMMNEDELKLNKAIITKVSAPLAFPCRVSLDFGEVGEDILLVNYNDHDVNSPYNSNYAIFVRKDAQEIQLEPNELAPVFTRNSPIALRGFDKNGFLQMAEIEMGPKIANNIEKFFENPQIEYIHAHFTAYGCYAAKIVRA